MQRILLGLICLLLLPRGAAASEGTGLQISAAVDLYGRGAFKGGNTSSTLDIRGAELLLYAPADHLFDGQLSFAFHGFEEAPKVELHEAYIGSTKLLPRSRFRLGQFFLGIGRLPQFHQHDWPFIAPPKVHATFFGQEGLMDTGIEYSWLAPLPFFLELTVGLTKGFVFGHDHSRGAPPQIPTNYLRLTTYLPMPWEGGAQLGVNYLGRRGNEGLNRTFFGADFTAKWRDNGVVQFLFQSEIWYRELTPPGQSTQKALGFYLYPELHLGGSFFAGLRLDYYSELNMKDAIGIAITSNDMNFVPTLTYRPSEFVTMRLAYNHRPEFQGSPAAVTSNYIELQSIFLLGAHPAHDF